MNMLKHVALVGRPNVGKSRLFNRLLGKRLSIVHDQPGVTRDVITAEVHEHFVLMDTGGIGMEPEMTPKAISEATEEQVDFALDAADIILFICDGQEGWTTIDSHVADKLRRYGKPTLLIVNKIDLLKHEEKAHEFYKKGFGDPILISAEHGFNSETLMEKILELVGPKPEKPLVPEGHERTQIAFVGRPNVGKSSLSNQLLGNKRLIVSEIAGTTREAVKVNFDFTTQTGKIWPFTLVDTAGLRPKSKINTPLEYFSSLRSQEAMEDVDVVFLVIEAKTGITTQDKRLADQILDAGRALAVIVNKWDHTQKAFEKETISGYEDIKAFEIAFEEAIRKEFFFLQDFPILFTSAETGKGIEAILKAARKLKRRQDQTLPTSQINRVIQDLMIKREPKIVGNGRFKVYYAVQVRHRPHTIRLYCNKEGYLMENYKRYLLTQFIEAFELGGCPVRFQFSGKGARYAKKAEE